MMEKPGSRRDRYFVYPEPDWPLERTVAAIVSNTYQASKDRDGNLPSTEDRIAFRDWTRSVREEFRILPRFERDRNRSRRMDESAENEQSIPEWLVRARREDRDYITHYVDGEIVDEYTGPLPLSEQFDE